MSRGRILFFSEAATLAHVARPASLARALSARHEVTLARAPWAERFIDAPEIRQVALFTQPSSVFLEALRRGRPVYDLDTLERYVQADLELIDAIAPDVVVGDFRLSLSVSARLRRVPYIAISNAYWCPGHRGRFPLPVLPWTSWVPLPLAERLFALAGPIAMAAHASVVDRLRQRHGLPGLGGDLRRAYTDADWLALADAAELFPLSADPGTPHPPTYLGPLHWSAPGAALPTIPSSAGERKRLAYVSLGSSGATVDIDTVIDGLLAADHEVWLSTAGRASDLAPRPHLQCADWLPGEQACREADLVVCNGGSLGVQQALAAGRPVLGIASNMDQFMNMGPVVEAGAGLLLRADRLDAERIRHAASGFGAGASALAAARRLSSILARYDAVSRFEALVSRALGEPVAPREESHAKDPAWSDPGLRVDVLAGGTGGLVERAMER